MSLILIDIVSILDINQIKKYKINDFLTLFLFNMLHKVII